MTKILREHPTFVEMNKLLDEWREDDYNNDKAYNKAFGLEFEWKDIFRKATDEERLIFKIGRTHIKDARNMSGRKNSWGKIAHQHRGELLDIIKRLQK